MLNVALDDPPDEGADTFADAVAALYRDLATKIRGQDRHVVRIWNFVPNIQGEIDGAGDRYMAFNIGRFAAYTEWFGGMDAFRNSLPTSSAVGIRENALHVYALTCEQPGRSIENPRQIPSYRYSRRYGRRPPCFARATRLDSTLLIGGTASILGERSSHPDDVDAQTRETFRNISALIQAGSDGPLQLPLNRLRSLRLHVREADDAPAVMSVVQDLGLDRLDLEVVEAPLCRKELLVEIEGLASYG
jgi:chorismate lyase/3-hydroxybenzoate synthase